MILWRSSGLLQVLNFLHKKNFKKIKIFSIFY
nr:MAG TPA: hypothetical protein [Caudoviricetes sp.]